MMNVRDAKLKSMLEERRRLLHDQMRRSIRGSRDTGHVNSRGPVTDLSDDPVDDDIDFALAELQLATMRQIQAAVERIESSQYGICELCHRKISAARLRALPFATCCRECQETIDRTKTAAYRHDSRGCARL
jgi:DnaK suppressor protein